jgi:hypothetical protein
MAGRVRGFIGLALGRPVALTSFTGRRDDVVEELGDLV